MREEALAQAWDLLKTMVANYRTTWRRAGTCPTRHRRGAAAARAAGAARHRQGRVCKSAWNMDPVFGVIGIQSDPRGEGSTVASAGDMGAAADSVGEVQQKPLRRMVMVCG
jgi:hypothetical protein